MLPIDVVGLGLNPVHLPEALKERINTADVLVGGQRQLGAFPDACGERIPVASPLSAVIEAVRERAGKGRSIMVLADGDPLFYGIGKRLADALGPGSMRIHPGVTTLQTAAARLGLAWHDIHMVSLHGRLELAPLFAALTWKRRVGVFTDADNSPAAIARALLSRGVAGVSMWVFEDLESDIERVGKYDLRQAETERFSNLNFVYLERIREPRVNLRLGIPDEDFAREEGLITKGPVRAAGLAALSIKQDSVVWDLGAGCGSVAVEAAVLAREGRVVAVERNPERVDMLERNIRRTGAWLVEPVQGEMPGCLDDLPEPDRIFVGGGLGRDDTVLEAACERLAPGGRITAHIILLDSLSRAKAHLKRLGWPVSISQVQCSRSRPLAGDVRMEGQNPVFIVSARKPAPDEGPRA